MTILIFAILILECLFPDTEAAVTLSSRLMQSQNAADANAQISVEQIALASSKISNTTGTNRRYSCSPGYCDTSKTTCCTKWISWNVPAPTCNSGCFLCPAGSFSQAGTLTCSQCSEYQCQTSSGTWVQCTYSPPGKFCLQ